MNVLYPLVIFNFNKQKSCLDWLSIDKMVNDKKREPKTVLYLSIHVMHLKTLSKSTSTHTTKLNESLS